MTCKFVTVHLLSALPMHNLNRDQNGLPKTATDGAVQRARLSAQALKRAARVAFREADPVGSVRTRQGATLVVEKATQYAAENTLPFDPALARTAATKIVNGLAKADASESEKDNILFYSHGELDTLARALVHAQGEGPEPTEDDFILDVVSPSLDVAAFGRMFAADTAKGTRAAVSVSHAVTTHQMNLITDYFTAVEEALQDHGGAAHIAVAYYTSGVYYRTFTIDRNQLARSWSSFGADSARHQVAALVKALITALPTGRSTNTAPNTLPFLVVAEQQKTRVAYGFETPVQQDETGGYTGPSARALAAQRALALEFDAALFGDAAYLTSGADVDVRDATRAGSLDDLVRFVVESVFSKDTDGPGGTSPRGDGSDEPGQTA